MVSKGSWVDRRDPAVQMREVPRTKRREGMVEQA